MRFSVVDLGSNTMRMSVYEERGGVLRHMLSEREMIGLIGYTADGILSAEGIARVVNTLAEFRDTSAAIGCDSFSCFATAGLRNIKNTAEAVAAIRRRTGVAVTVISGEEEARLDFIGAYKGAGAERGLMVDMGGGSTELVLFRGREILRSASLPFGSLLLYKTFVHGILPAKAELAKITAFAEKQLAPVQWAKSRTLCVIGGTGRAAARLRQEIYEGGPRELQGYRFPAADLRAMLRRLSGPPKKKNARLLTRVVPERIHTVLPGLCAFSRIAKAAGAETVIISRNGVREGFLHEYVLGEAQKQEEVQR